MFIQMLGRLPIVLIIIGSGLQLTAADPAGLEFFEKKIRPVLVSECYKCHSKDEKVKGELRLDWKGGWQKGGESGATIIPGRVGQSLLIQAIRHADADLKMPPKKKLSAEQIADFEKWVAMGAPDPRTTGVATESEKKLNLEAARRFWAFQPVSKPPVPKLKRAEWAYTDIDHFVLTALEGKGIGPVQDANNLILLRRLYFDLIGLPPTPDQMAAFEQAAVKDRKAAIAKVVDELLVSPHFGERWGRHWLDVVRFSESTGGGRTALMKEAWRYRDYVVNAFNADKPYTDFIREQIAGDLIEDGSIEQQRDRLTATAFLLLGPTNYELQDKTVLEMDIVDEQMDTMGKAFMALTIGCARCHDHKFDPIRTEDYYGMAGIFKSTKAVIHSNVSTWNKRPLPMSPEQEKISKQQTTQITALRNEINQLKKKTGGKPSALPNLQVKDLPGIVVDNPDAKVMGPWNKSSSVKNHVGSEYLYASNSSSKVVYPVKFAKGGKYEVRISFAHHPNRSTKTLVTVRHNDGENAFRINQKKEPAVDGYFQSLGFFEFQSGQWDAVEISAMGGDGAVIADAVQFLPEGTKSSRKKKKSVARKELHQALDDLVDGKLEARHIPHIAWLLKLGKVNLPDELLKSWQSALDGLAKEARWESRLAVSSWGGTGVDEHILARGSPQSPGERVGRNLPELLAMAPLQNRSPGRLELARQLTAKDHPLTSRVMVNRIWHQLFGRGIVSTPDNFGWLGQRPSHPELLDYLAVEFAKTHSHSLKSFIERIVLTKTFGMSSTAADPAYAEKDQDNRWLHRMPMRRLEAEAIRDSALAISGRLDRTVGGKPIPVHLTEFVVGRGSPKKSGPLDGAGRRSIYTALRRNFIPTLMLTFDFPGPFTTMGKRDITNVAGQSLALMNDRFLYEQSGLWANRIIKEQASAPERIRRMYAEAFARPPSDGELSACLEALTAFAELYGGDPNGHEAWRDLCHSFYSMTDFIYLK